MSDNCAVDENAAAHWADIKQATLADAKEVFEVGVTEFRERVRRTYSGDQIGQGRVQGFYCHGTRLFAITSLRQCGDDWLAVAREALTEIPKSNGHERVRTVMHGDRQYWLDTKLCVIVIQPTGEDKTVSSPVQLGLF